MQVLLTSRRRLGLRAVAAVLSIAFVGSGDTGPSTGEWHWWEPRAVLFAVGAVGGPGVTITAVPSPCGVLGPRPFDARLLCPADLGPGWAAVDLPQLLLADCKPYGQIDTMGLTDGSTWLREQLVDEGSSAAAAASLPALVRLGDCRNLGHGVQLSAPSRMTVDGLPAMLVTERTPAGNARFTYLSVGSSVLVIWADGPLATTPRLFEVAIARVRAPRRQSNVVDVVAGTPYGCDSPPVCAAQDNGSSG